MANNIPNINIGKSVRKRECIDLTHDNTTTAHWGFVQPLYCKEMVPHETLEVNVDAFVRLAPMVSPTMARATYNSYHQFVPMSTLWEPFESFISQQPYASQTGATYVPDKIPGVDLNLLTKYIVAKYSDATSYTLTGYTSDHTTNCSYTSKKPLSASGSAARWNQSNYYCTDASGSKITPTFIYSSTGVNCITPSGADYIDIYTYQNGDTTENVMTCFKLNRKGRNLRQILQGLGYRLNVSDNTRVSILPIIAYYKAYFDIFYIQRNFTWKQTECARFMMYLQSNNVNTLNMNTGVSGITLSSILDHEIAWCYYSASPDKVSMAVQNIVDVRSTAQPTYLDFEVTADNAVSTGLQKLPSISTGNAIDRTRLRILDKLTTMVNKNTLIGGRIKEYLASQYGATFKDAHESNYAGSDSINIQITDVMSLADTTSLGTQLTAAGSNLGDYAGKGIGYGSGNTHKFDANTFGYYIVLSAVVPQSSFNQGMDRNLTHIDRYDFYTPEFDAVGWQVMRVNEVMCQDEATNKIESFQNNSSSSFGFVPRYSEYKVAQNVINGDCALRSSANSYKTYTLDKMISDSQVTDTSYNSAGSITYVDPTNFVAGTNWRYVGKEPWMTNFNRIFVNSGKETVEANVTYQNTPDNFIIHHVLGVKAISPMLSLSSSYDTFTDSDTDSIDVELV